MTKTNHLRIVLFVVLSLSACKHDNGVVPKAQALIDRAHACADLRCALAAEDDLSRLYAEDDLGAGDLDFLLRSTQRIAARIAQLELDTAQRLVKETESCNTASCVDAIVAQLRAIAERSHVTDPNERALLTTMPGLAQHRIAAIDKRELVSRLRALKDRLCACADTDCVADAYKEAKLISAGEDLGEAGDAIDRERLACMKVVAERKPATKPEPPAHRDERRDRFDAIDRVETRLLEVQSAEAR
jgi:hypothetical protein